ncbi:MAG: NUDIX hydrolase [Candidatus Pacebacteria bacterium]|nr:NUDIX hydrolase [Candidatus Paceibacterota bacterium]
MSQTTHFCGAILYRTPLDSSDVEFLVIEYLHRGRCAIKFAGGTNSECPEEAPLATLVREIAEELGIILSRSADHVFEIPKGPDHIQYWFVYDHEVEGTYTHTLRTIPMRDGDEELSPPRWIKASELVREGGPDQIFHSHLIPLRKAAEIISQQDRDAAMALMCVTA